MSPIQLLSEENLIDLLKKKDQRGYTYLYDKYAEALYGVVFRVVAVSHYAEEVIQEVFVKIWKCIEQFDPAKGRLYTWMINIARNTALDYVKTKAVRNDQKNQSLSNFVDSKEDHQFSNAEQALKADYIGFKGALHQLKPEWLILIEMAYYEGYTQQEIATRLAVPLGTIKTRTRAALLALQEVLKEYK